MTDDATLRDVIALQVKEIDRLRAEVERLQSVIAQSTDAMTVLTAVYTDPTIRPDIRVAAAKAVLPHQHAKLSIHGYANVTSLAHRLDNAQHKIIEQIKHEDAAAE